MYEAIDILELDSIVLNDNLIDIRDKYEYLLGNISGSKNIPYNYLQINPENYLDKEKTYYLYCDSGNRSRKLCTLLNMEGYHTVDLVGGYSKYINKN